MRNFVSHHMRTRLRPVELYFHSQLFFLLLSSRLLLFSLFSYTIPRAISSSIISLRDNSSSLPNCYIMKALFALIATDFSETSEKAVDISEPIPRNKRTIRSSKSQNSSVGILSPSSAQYFANSVIRDSENVACSVAERA